jgi:hypothetical protein
MLPDGADSRGSLSPYQAGPLLPARAGPTAPDGSDARRLGLQRR